jgi:hypothetical protein
MNGLLKTLMRPDREENPEQSIVAQAANILQVGEFQVLQLAYCEWYGQDMADHISDRIFKAHMLHGQVPEWAEEYARRIIRQDEIGLIDGSDPQYHRFDQEYVTHVSQGVRHFTIICLIFAMLVVGTLFVGQVAGFKATSVLPPYFSEEELRTDR